MQGEQGGPSSLSIVSALLGGFVQGEQGGP